MVFTKKMKSKKLFLIFHGRFPGEKPSSLFAAKSAEAFGEVIETVLLVPRRFGRFQVDSYKYFGIKKNFTVVFLPTIDLFWLPYISKFAFTLSYIVFGLVSALYIFLKSTKETVVYSNEAIPLFFASFFRKNCFYEMHDFPKKSAFFLYRLLFKRVKGVLIHNTWKAEMAVKFLGVTKDRVICELNAVEVEKFDNGLSQEEARKHLGLLQGSKCVVYTGSLYKWKGVDTFALAAKTLPDVHFYCIGGSPLEVENFTRRYADVSNLHAVGHQEHQEVVFWQKAADVLVIPNTAKEDISKYYTSPMKLFEYMSSSRVIVASRIPSIEEIVDENDVYFFTPDDSTSLADTVMQALASLGVDSKQKVISSLAKAKLHTWGGRRDRIIYFVERLT